MLNENQENEWTDVKEELSKPLIRPVWRMLLHKDVKLIEKMSTKTAGNLTVPITKKQVKLLY